MSWTVFTENLAAGTAPFVAAIEEQLTAHPAWEFVEEIEEYTDQEFSTGVYFHYYTITLRIWKCLGTVNSLGQDYFIALQTTTTFSQYGEPQVIDVGWTTDEGLIWLFGFEQYDATEKKHIRPVGFNYGYDNPELFVPDATDHSVRGDLAFHFVQSQISEDGLTWGDWTSWGKDIATAPPNLNDNTPFDMSYSYLISGASTSDDPESIPAVGSATMHIRVSNDGLFIRCRTEGEWSVNLNYIYCGLGDESARPAELQGGFPLVFTDYLAPGFQAQPISQSRYPEAALIPQSEPPTGVVGSYDSYMRPTSDATSRLDFPYPVLEPYVFVQLSLTTQGEAVNPYSAYGAISGDPGIRLPGLYNASNGGGGHWVSEDTINSPEGHTCILFATDDTPGSSTYWIAVDTEID